MTITADYLNVLADNAKVAAERLDAANAAVRAAQSNLRTRLNEVSEARAQFHNARNELLEACGCVEPSPYQPTKE
jgi:hypothetical protein